MKYIIICLAAAIVVYGAAYLIARVILRAAKGRKVEIGTTTEIDNKAEIGTTTEIDKKAEIGTTTEIDKKAEIGTTTEIATITEIDSRNRNENTGNSHRRTETYAGTHSETYAETHAETRLKTDLKTRLQTLAITFLLGTAMFILAALAYLGIYYHADNTAQAALKGNEKVSVSEIAGGYFFDGPASTQAIAFYPGAKVECEAYAALMLKLAENGYDCFLLDMPLNFALLGEDIADQVVNSYDYDIWLMAGHSMGGIVASDYAAKHPDRISGIILLASYSTTELDNSFKAYSIYGSEDKCLDRDAYNDNKHNLPGRACELVIEGGNHSQFGNYGKQKGDGAAAISSEEQQRITAEAIAQLQN